MKLNLKNRKKVVLILLRSRWFIELIFWLMILNTTVKIILGNL